MLLGSPALAQEERTSDATPPRATAATQGRPSPSRAGSQSPAEILLVRFQATAYEVRGPSDQLGRLDAKALTSEAATPEALRSALAQTGKVRLLYRLDQPVNVFSSRTVIGSSEPVLTGTRTTTAGQPVNSISYQNVGFIVGLSAQGRPDDRGPAAPMVTAAFKLSVLHPGEKEIGPDQRESVARVVSLDHSAAFEPNRPHVVLAISSNTLSSFRRSAEENSRTETPTAPVAYVVRYEFGSPSQERASGAGISPAAREAGPGGPAEALPATSTNTLTAQFQATIYEVETVTNRLPTAAIEGLERARTPEQLLLALNDVGSPRVLYRLDQPVNVFGDQVMIQTNKPMVTGTRSGRDGQPVNSYVSHRQGIRVQLSAQAPPIAAKRPGPDVTISFNVATDAPGYTDFGSGQMARSFPMVSQEHNEPLEPGRPRLMVAMGSPSMAEAAKPFIYVVWYRFDLPGTR